MSDELRFEILGPMRVWRGKAEVEIGSPQQRAILGILLLRAGAVVTPDQLVSAIWGQAPPPAAVGMVRSYISRLRRALGDGRRKAVIESVGGGYSLPAGRLSLDYTDFHHRIGKAREARHASDLETEATELRAALALWKGNPLAGVRGEYAEHESIRLLQARLTAIEDLAAADLELGRHVEAAAALAPVVREQPLRERPCELLMLALYRSGRQAEALKVYQGTQRLLADELGLDPGPKLQEMQRRILRSDPTLTAPATAGRSSSYRPSVPGQVQRPTHLPPDLPGFVGRTDALRLMADALKPSEASVPVFGLTGLAGIGKTALAVHAGHAFAADFPDGQLFVDLGSSADPLAVLLRAVGVDGQAVPDSPAERAGLWRSLTAGRRLLLVLDDARDEKQVQSLLPGSGGAAVVITARQRLFGLAYAQWLKLDGLTEDESLALLEHLVGARRIQSELADARQLLRISAGLPQSVHATGARLASRPEWSLATALKRIGNRGRERELQHSECQVVEAPYESLLRGLSPSQARALRLLAVPEGADLSLTAAAAVLDIPIHETESLLESLADLHLIEPCSEDRYRYLHPVRVFARSHALLEDGRAGWQAALARLTRFYLATTRNALLAIDPSSAQPNAEPSGLTFATAETAQAWLLLEYEQLRIAVAQTTDIPDAPAHQLAQLIDRTAQSIQERSLRFPRTKRLVPLGIT